jgi:hypothetical protein
MHITKRTSKLEIPIARWYFLQTRHKPSPQLCIRVPMMGAGRIKNQGEGERNPDW